MGTWEGEVFSIHIAPQAAALMQSVSEVRAVPGRGLEGDRYFTGTGFLSSKPIVGGHEITLIEIETLEALFGSGVNAAGDQPGISIKASDTRRNVVTSGVPLSHLFDREFWVGAVLLRGTRLSEPCKHLEELTEPGIRSALTHRAGLRARILSEGIIHVGDVICPRDSRLQEARGI